MYESMMYDPMKHNKMMQDPMMYVPMMYNPMVYDPMMYANRKDRSIRYNKLMTWRTEMYLTFDSECR